MTDTADMPKATRREWIGLAVLALPCLLYSMDLTVLILAVPHLSADLQPTGTQLLWIMDIYGFLVAGSLITMGTLGDRIGRRKLLMIGGAAFGLTSIFAAFAPSAEMLILARALLGISAATLAPSTLSLIRNMFLDPKQRTVAISVWVASFSAGGALGPVIGGALLACFWWGSVFLIAVPVMVLLLTIGPFLLPEYRDPNAGRLDIRSAVLSLTAVLSSIYGIKRIAAHGTDEIAAVSIIAGLIIGALFVLRQRNLADPLIDVRLFRIPAFSTSVTCNIFGVFVAFGFFLFLAQYFQLVLGMGPLEAGLWTAPSGIVFAAGSMVAPWILSRVRPGYVLAGGFVCAGLGCAMLAHAIGMQQGFGMLMTAFMVFCLGLAPIFTLTTDVIIGTAPPERAGAASAISETGAEFGGAMGIAMLGSILTAIYRWIMADAVPANVAPDAAEAARNTLGGALTAAAQLPAAQGEALAAAARAAFTQGFVAVAALSAVIAVATAILAMAVLRRVGIQNGEKTVAAASAD
ncbi:MFS transporter [uncultured Ferrovibrio sp.]|uniref:MFS transporter n=1 Tax=uncultured Ferrovibrio sp. TaxID=1576913 RepID=UPI00263149C9|nr:MFS transporter [uncultured Ferrovibrio sp.]